ncbi:hypothetical protein DBR17_06205 [Sphingomonas sp. HMWF008]|nr:hypothetical protein DBR17_06205 [Sphingomonas sp. HMWF008]
MPSLRTCCAKSSRRYPASMAELRLSGAARRDLREIRREGVRLHGDAASEAYLLGLDRLFALLRQQPFAGQARAEFRQSMRSLSHRPHRILYHVEGNTVIIDRILHQARDVGRALREDQ